MCNRKLCLECTSPLAGKKDLADFCTDKCRKTWNNRRATRGAELYDIFMAIRFRRSVAGGLGLWQLMCRMASVWKHEDDDAGRRSFSEPEVAKMRAIRYVATKVKAHSR